MSLAEYASIFLALLFFAGALGIALAELRMEKKVLRARKERFPLAWGSD